MGQAEGSCFDDLVLFNDVGWQAEACPIQANVKVAVTIEVVRTHEDVSDAQDSIMIRVVKVRLYVQPLGGPADGPT